MRLQTDTEQTILCDAVERFLAERYGYRRVREIVDRESGWDADAWRSFAELGWLGMPFSVEDGGSGAGAVETAILMEAFGKNLVPQPYLATIVLCGGLIAALAEGAERRERLAPVIAGEGLLAFADDDGPRATAAERSSTGYMLSGSKRLVLAAPNAGTIFVSASLRHGKLGVFVVPVQTPGLTIHPCKLVDGSRAADIEFGDVSLPGTALLGNNTDAGAAIEAVREQAVVALCADAVGAIAALVAATTEYAKTRAQFGQPIGKFQALQHRLVQLKIREEEARASCLFATLSLGSTTIERRRAISGAKAKIGHCARFVYQNAIQLHGAIGTTEELSIGAYAKRLMAFETLFGSTRAHLRRYAGFIAQPGLAAKGLLGSQSG